MTENKSLLSTILVIIIVGLCFFWFRQIGPGDVGSPEIENKDIIEHIKFLSDDKRAGRYPGTRESKDVIAYIINQFKVFGVQQAGEGSSFKQTFSILDSVKIGKNNSLKINDRPLNIEKDYIPLWFSGNVEEVRGPGVIGLQPLIKPGMTFEYSSFCPLKTPLGIMSGSYQMKLKSEETFDAPIPAFSLHATEHID